jgi:hypothetical protein
LADSRSAYTSLREHFLRYIENPEELASALDPLDNDRNVSGLILYSIALHSTLLMLTSLHGILYDRMRKLERKSSRTLKDACLKSHIFVSLTRSA